jgi:hypothetical protein
VNSRSFLGFFLRQLRFLELGGKRNDNMEGKDRL